MEEPDQMRPLNFVRIISFAVSLINSVVVLHAFISLCVKGEKTMK
jgi:hypothetical protein